MATSSDSDDASELFWPGYVDAVTNLAINLLFVIAIMAIVVMTANLQISQLVPKTSGITDESDRPPASGKIADKKLKYQDTLETVVKAQTVYKKMLDELKNNENIALKQAPTVTELDLILQDLEGKLERTIESQRKEDFEALKVDVELKNKIKKLELQIALNKKQEDKLKNEQDKEKYKDRVKEGSTKPNLFTANKNSSNPQDNEASAEDLNKPLQEVRVDQIVNKTTKGQSKLQDLNAGGIVVVFGNDVIELSENEINDLIKKLTASGPIKGARWQLRVISPKGFSEATRIAYYRVNSLRNVLLKNGAISSDIEMRVVEAEGGQANNSRVLIRQLP